MARPYLIDRVLPLHVFVTQPPTADRRHCLPFPYRVVSPFLKRRCGKWMKRSHVTWLGKGECMTEWRYQIENRDTVRVSLSNWIDYIGRWNQLIFQSRPRWLQEIVNVSIDSMIKCKKMSHKNKTVSLQDVSHQWHHLDSLCHGIKIHHI